ARGHRLDDSLAGDVQRRIQLGDWIAFEANGAVSKNLETAPLEVVEASNRVDSADDRHRLTGFRTEIQVAAERQVDRSKAKRLTGCRHVPRLNHEVVRNDEVDGELRAPPAALGLLNSPPRHSSGFFRRSRRVRGIADARQDRIEVDRAGGDVELALDPRV